MIEVKIRLSSRQRVYVPDVQPWDRDSGEAVDPVAAGILPIFALVAADAPDPADDAYVNGSWAANKPTPTAVAVIGAGAPLEPAGSGQYDLWMGVSGITDRPRDVVARIYVP